MASTTGASCPSKVKLQQPVLASQIRVLLSLQAVTTKSPSSSQGKCAVWILYGGMPLGCPSSPISVAVHLAVATSQIFADWSFEHVKTDLPLAENETDEMDGGR
eukprot:TRINITY_DN80067_c0_g1_i1.p2 TRINITY_DN80067_c0_g1~~TRINITY_DN80067_c0_g1_i1.p2  ORF type:complete len:104 (-),score=10.68 TRINITY_DN80067_c0_g1_i1:41-352(-)